MQPLSTSPAGHDPLPDFLIIGAMKCGTTSLYHYLKSHPQIFMSTRKELDFFTEEFNWSKGMDWYRRQFGGSEHAMAVGEASTSYAKYPRHVGVPERIANCLPQARFIYMVRHPIERIRSHYLHRVATGGERASINDAVLDKPMYVAFSRYAMQIERYLEHFPRSRIMIVTTEELREERSATLKSIFAFVGVNQYWTSPAFEESHFSAEQRRTYPRILHKLKHLPGGEVVAKKLPAGIKGRLGDSFDRAQQLGTGLISEGVRDQLRDRLVDDVERLRGYMPGDFDGWGML